MAEIPSNAVLSASELTVRYGAQTVLNRATLAINQSERVGLVGRNGCGKSTFLRIANGDLEPDSGQVVRRRNLITGYLPQEFTLDDAATVHANILSGAQHVLALIREYEEAPPESTRSAELLDRIQHFDGWNIEHRIKHLVTHLSAPEGDRIVGTLSGGEKRRVALCRALLAQPDLLILDEPTNHLDTESILWLEEFLAHYPGACLFVTHDRYFLDRISTRIVELANGEFLSHAGNYTAYLEAKAERQASEEQQEKKRQKFLKRELEWVRRGPRARRTKSVDRIERYHELAAQDGPEQELDVELIIPDSPPLANRVIALKNVSMAVSGRTLIRDFSIDFAEGARVGIVGRNGLGKSTLLRVILKLQEPANGEVEHGSRTQINYVDQSRLLLDQEKTIYDEVGGNTEFVRLGEETISLRSYLRRFLFTEERINTKIAQLSGGERSRVLLAKILKRGGNVLVLDEPTNDLDLATLRVLEEALVLFKGTVIVVSHDRYFLNRVCTQILAFEGDGEIAVSEGNYDYYLEKRARAAATEKAFLQAAKASQNLLTANSAREKPRKMSYKDTRELETIEADILAVEQEVTRLEAIFADPDFYTKHGEDWAALDAQLKAAQARVPQLYARWEELEKMREAQNAS